MPARFPHRAVLLATGLALVATFVPAVADAASPHLKPAAAKVAPASTAAPAPADAAKDPELRLTAIACPGSGNCMAIGTYHAKSGAHRGVIEHFVHGTWHATAAPEPVFAATDPKVTLKVITCASIKFCVAFGTYIDATDAPQKQALLETYERESPDDQLAWSGSRLFATPGGATVAEIAAASCTPERTCVAVGSYVSGAGVRHAQLETYHRSGWVPTNANLPLNAQGASSLAAVDCPAKNTCFAMGDYHTNGGEHAGLLMRLDSSGTWTPGRAKDVGNAQPGDPNTHLSAVSCPTAAYCAIGGRYTSGGTKTRRLGYLETWSDSEFSDGRAAPVPTGSAIDPAMSITGMSCAAVRDCVATSPWAAAHGHQVGALLRFVGGQWHVARTDLQHAAANPHVDLTGLACGRVAVGSFTDRDGHTRPMFQTLGAHGWTGRTGPLPTGAGHRAAALAAVACNPGGGAIAVGRYVDRSGRHRGMITRHVPA